MDALFAIDHEARQAEMPVAERHALRRERAPQLLAAIHEKLITIQPTLLPRSKTGEAVHYTLSLWRKLTLFLEHPVLELSNNLAENSMRPIAMGRSLCPIGHETLEVTLDYLGVADAADESSQEQVNTGALAAYV